MSNYPQPNYGYSNQGLTSRGGTGQPSSSSSGGQNREEVSVQLGHPALEYEEGVHTLRQKVKLLKRMSNSIGEETSLRGKLIDSLSSGFDSATESAKKAKKELDKVYKQARAGHLLALMFFSVGLFVFVYLVYKANRFARWFLPKGRRE
jgi:hypothetical protein|tara:strand:+ start:976 stop:1422 length:447 start_codon:yes stop_codon:yes gene_type:complete